MVTYFLKFLIFLFKTTFCVAIAITALITVGAFIAAVFDVFPVVGIILAAITVSVIVYRVFLFIKDKKEEKLFRKAEENRRKEINKELEKHRAVHSSHKGKNNENTLFKIKR